MQTRQMDVDWHRMMDMIDLALFFSHVNHKPYQLLMDVIGRHEDVDLASVDLNGERPAPVWKRCGTRQHRLGREILLWITGVATLRIGARFKRGHGNARGRLVVAGCCRSPLSNTPNPALERVKSNIDRNQIKVMCLIGSSVHCTYVQICCRPTRHFVP